MKQQTTIKTAVAVVANSVDFNRAVERYAVDKNVTVQQAQQMLIGEVESDAAKKIADAGTVTSESKAVPLSGSDGPDRYGPVIETPESNPVSEPATKTEAAKKTGLDTVLDLAREYWWVLLILLVLYFMRSNKLPKIV